MLKNDRIIPREKAAWQKALINAITDPAELCQILELSPTLLTAAKKAATLFPLRVPRNFVARMQKGNPKDPLLLQVLPLQAEFKKHKAFSENPLTENKFNPLPGLLHKYPTRVLITLTGNCAVNCRYCFRRNFPYSENLPAQTGLDKILDYIARATEVNEVILSGGDPLNTSDVYLESLIYDLATIPHLKRVRIHSRLPIVLPERISDTFCELFTATRLQAIMVLHSNHPNEIEKNVISACHKMAAAGITLLNQSVLLKDVNDDATVLAELSEQLFAAGVLPYYLHLLDKVSGSSHFLISDRTAKTIYRELQSKLPGFLVPKLVREIPGENSKTMLTF